MSQWKNEGSVEARASKIIKDARSVVKTDKALWRLQRGRGGLRQQSSSKIQGRGPKVLLLPGAGKMQVMSCVFALAATRQNSSCQMRVAISVPAADTEEAMVYLLGAASSLSVLIFTNAAMNTEMFTPCLCKQCSQSVTERCMTFAN